MSRPKGTGCVYQRPDSSVWWIKYSRNGKDFRESTHTDNKRKAERLLKQRVAELVTGTFLGLHVERVRVEELADDFLRDYRINKRKSRDDAEARWNLHLKPFFAVMRAVDVSSGLIVLLASWFGPFRRFNLAHPGTLKVKRIEFRSAGA
jgi:hypothetical protein